MYLKIYLGDTLVNETFHLAEIYITEAAQKWWIKVKESDDKPQQKIAALSKKASIGRFDTKEIEKKARDSLLVGVSYEM